jgi:hypothetical protein
LKLNKEIDQMKHSTWIIITIFSLLVSACGSSATPTVNPADVQNTAIAAAFTVVAETQAAIPTDTPIPPTNTPSPTPPPTETPLPSPTLNSLLALPTGIPTFTAQPPSSTSSGDPCNQPLTSWKGPSANLTISNETKPQGTLVLSLYVVTDLGECGYLYVYSDSLSGPVGQYSAGAFVTGKQNFKVFGGFRITEGGWKIVVRNDKIIAMGSCYPNC